MAKKKRPLTQAEIWDDSALQQSWDDAVEEYKLYHSVHARGERVEDVIKKYEDQDEDEEMIANGVEEDSSAVAPLNNGADSEDLEEGELEANAYPSGIDTETKLSDAAERAQADESIQQKHPASTNTGDLAQSASGMPNPIFATVQDEVLRNLMMSWYYAGYYTGLYEGQQNATQTQAATKDG